MSRASILTLAQDLNDMRYRLNAVNGLDDQRSAYGDVAEALKKVLAFQFGKGMAIEVYALLIETDESVEACVKAIYDRSK